jgi:hypothetical protein
LIVHDRTDEWFEKAEFRYDLMKMWIYDDIT